MRPQGEIMNASIPAALYAAIERELLMESAIHPAFLGTAIQIIPDIEFDPVTKEAISTPIADARGIRQTRFGHSTGPNQAAAQFTCEDGLIWQLKIFREGHQGERSGDYRAPNDIGNRAFLPVIPPEVRKLIGDRYGISVPIFGSFWDWLAAHPEIPILVTEGAKKALAALSLGYVAIALYGCRCVRSRDLDRFIDDGGDFPRTVLMALDRGDYKAKARKNVAWGNRTLAKRVGDECKILIWDPKHKAIDDLIVSEGAETFEQVVANAPNYHDHQQFEALKRSLRHYRPTVSVHVPELAQAVNAASIPTDGIVAIRAPKGTGKSQFVRHYLKNAPKVLSIVHRVSLGRGLAFQFGLKFFNDLDRAAGSLFDDVAGKFVGDRLALCVDSLLGINPENFRGGVLVLDEVDQMLTHLLTGSTCNTGGKRGMLITRFAEILQVVRQVIILSADLTDREIDYLAKMRDEGDRPWILENTYHRNSYPCRFIECGDDSAAIAELLEAAERGERLWVTSDQRGTLQRIARILKDRGITKLLEINGSTSSGDDAKAFMSSPDQYLSEHEIQVVLASPSVPTGLSIEKYQFDRVFGLFHGGAFLAKDCSQTLSRVREAIPRTVWAKKRGSGYNKISSKPRGFQILGELERKTRLNARLLGDQLAEELQESISGIDYQTATMRLYGSIAAEQNRSAGAFRRALRCRLEFEQNDVERVSLPTCSATREALKEAGEALKIEKAQEIVDAERISRAIAQAWEHTDTLNPKQQASKDRFDICDWWVLSPDALTVDDVLHDRRGKTRRKIERLERQLIPELAIAQDVRKIERSFSWRDAEPTPWDFTTNVLEQRALSAIGFDKFLAWALQMNEWCQDSPEVVAIADKARECAADIKLALNITISEKMGNCQIIGELLDRLGLKTESERRRGEGHRGYFYMLDELHLQSLRETIARRLQRRDFQGGLPPLYRLFTKGVGHLEIAPIIDALNTLPTLNTPPPPPKFEPVQLVIA